jgi:hypothetical protein
LKLLFNIFKRELNILEAYNIIPKGDIFQKDDRIKAIAEAKEAIEEVEVDGLEDVTEELDAHAEKLDKVKDIRE